MHGKLDLRSDRGIAIAMVMLVGAVLVVLSSLMVARGFRQLVNTSNDVHWDNALFVAEAGLDDALHTLDYDFDFTTGQTIPDGTLGTDAERAWAVETADAATSDLVAVPEGEYVVVRPANSSVVFAVGYSPSREATDRRVRVIRAAIEGNPWEYQIEHALLVGGDIELSGNTTINDTNDNDGASVHSNGSVTGAGAYVVEGCVTSSESTFTATIACPPSPSPPEPMPVIDPLKMYPYAHYALCDDRVIYGGPTHPVTPDPDLIPCNGNETVTPLAGWTSSGTGGVVTWSAGPAAVESGVFYIDNGNYQGKLGTNTAPMLATLIASHGTGSTCQTPATGNIVFDGPSNVTVHPSLAAAGYDVVFVAQGDVMFAGSATVGGAILAHEQVDYRGGADSWGAVIGVDACDTVGSPISANTTTGTSYINYPGPLLTPFDASSLRVDVLGWYEL